MICLIPFRMRIPTNSTPFFFCVACAPLRGFPDGPDQSLLKEPRRGFCHLATFGPQTQIHRRNT